MKQIKKLYKVTKHETHDYGDGNIQEHTKDFTTWAVSEKKAIYIVVGKEMVVEVYALQQRRSKNNERY